MKPIRRKTFPLFGKVVDVAWKGDDHGTGLAEVLSNDETVKDLVKGIGNLAVRSYAKEFQGGHCRWTGYSSRQSKIGQPFKRLLAMSFHHLACFSQALYIS
jgi:hypothetical protein